MSYLLYEVEVQWKTLFTATTEVHNKYNTIAIQKEQQTQHMYNLTKQ